MCKVGDIILVKNYSHKGTDLPRHSFIVLSIENGTIQGMDYDMIANVLSSYKSEEQKAKKLSYPGNLNITKNDKIVPNGNGKNGYVKTDQLYFFNRDKLDYMVIGKTTTEFFNTLLEFIKESTADTQYIIDNL